ncbi:MAG: 5'-nucleotidase [Gammaproteobacteria bacterium]|nr:5'-nucleotidase [Gammaproteobacteria bacterium]
MSVELTDTLVIGISATALFELSEANEIFEKKQKEDPYTAMDEYRMYMLQHESEPLNDGTGMPLVKALLNLNNYVGEETPPIVEVVVISRNSPETGFRVLREIRDRKIPITRSAFTAGEDSSGYLEAFYVDLFLTTNEKDAQQVIDSGICASALVKKPPEHPEDFTDQQVRFAFDADAVIFDEASEYLYQTKGIKEFWSNEDESQDIPLHEGPYANLLKKLSNIKARIPGRIEYSPIKLAIFTSRNSPAEMRVVKTLRSWNVYVDQAFFLGGLDKSRFLKVFKPHIFFDDQDDHLSSASTDIPCAKVLYPSTSPLKQIMKEKARARSHISSPDNPS